MTRYLIIIEQTATGFSAYSPDVPGCVSTGPSISDVEASMREAIAAHLEELREDGVPAPAPTSFAAYVDVAA
jgi:predicted RNase H-like HicB family nuclease